ncbi:hypothetical protein QLX67_10330, partial [Balneolaceae bacterium ANBcel3]|nr:hypothetical protein [Balneolaceae bacterium ANBcel3]
MKNLIFATLAIVLLYSCSTVHSGFFSEKDARPLPGEIKRPLAYEQSIMDEVRTCDGRPGPAYWQQFTEYSIEAYLEPESYTLSGTVDITYFNHSPDTLNELQLELVQNIHSEEAPKLRPTEITGGMHIDNVAAQAKSLEQNIDHGHGYLIDGTRMVVFLPEPLIPSDSTSLSMDFSFKIPQRGAGGRMGHSRDNLFYLGYWYPHMVVYDDVVGWHPDPFLGQAEFYHGFADYHLTLFAPENWLVMATGDFLNPEEVLSPGVYSRWMEAWNSDEPVMVYDDDPDKPATLSYEKHRTKREPSGNIAEGRLLAWEFQAENVRDVAFSATRHSFWEAARTPVGDLTGNGETDYTLINTFWRDKA